MDEFISKDFLYAVVGATNKPGNAGYAILNGLRERGYAVVGISPYSDEINGIRCFESIIDFEDRPDVIIVATPPVESKEVVRECIDFGIDRFWFQPDCCSLELFQQLQGDGVMTVCDRDICLEL